MRMIHKLPTSCVPLCVTGVPERAAAAEAMAVPVLHVGRVTAGTVGVTVRDGTVDCGRDIPYVPEPGDVAPVQGQHRVVRRDGAFPGWLVGETHRLVDTAGVVVGKFANSAWMDQAASHGIVSDDAPACAPHLLTPDLRAAR